MRDVVETQIGMHRVKLRPVSQQQAGYLNEEHGPFLCGACVFYSARNEMKGTCRRVAGNIDFYGCCNLFKSTYGRPSV